MGLHEDARRIIDAAIKEALPERACERALKGYTPPRGRLLLVAVGKAAWRMAKAADSLLGGRIDGGIVITKYGHLGGELPFELVEAGHPVSDENSFTAASRAVALCRKLGADDGVLFLLSGGGSALFELPLISHDESRFIGDFLVKSGADIREINTVRKRLSAVKGGRFAEICAPAQVFTVVLSDIIGDPLDMIASGPTLPDSSSCADALAVAEKYRLPLSPAAKALLGRETPKTLINSRAEVAGNIDSLCDAAYKMCESLGYETQVVTRSLCCEADEAGELFAGLAANGAGKKRAYIAGGETVVHVHGKGRGGRNQQLALRAADLLRNVEGALVFSVGSDGTDGPTDAAGGIVDCRTAAKIEKHGIAVSEYLQNNDSYSALSLADALIITGPTGTNVNDLTVALTE